MSSTAADLPLGEGQGFLLPHSSSKSQEMLQIFEHLFRPTGMCSMKSTRLARRCGTSGSEGLSKNLYQRDTFSKRADGCVRSRVKPCCQDEDC